MSDTNLPPEQMAQIREALAAKASSSAPAQQRTPEVAKVSSSVPAQQRAAPPKPIGVPQSRTAQRHRPVASSAVVSRYDLEVRRANLQRYLAFGMLLLGFLGTALFVVRGLATGWSPTWQLLVAVIVGLALEALSTYVQYHYLPNWHVFSPGWQAWDVHPVYLGAIGFSVTANTLGYGAIFVPLLTPVVDMVLPGAVQSLGVTGELIVWLALIGVITLIQTRPEGILVDD